MRSSCVGSAAPAPSKREIETVEVDPVAMSKSKLESVVVSAKTMSKSRASVTVMLPPALYADCNVAEDEPVSHVFTLLVPSIQRAVPAAAERPLIINVESVSVVMVTSLVEVGVADRVVKAPVEAVDAPTVVPSIVPPEIATALAFCVAIVPRPRFVLAVVVLFKSERLLATCRNAAELEPSSKSASRPEPEPSLAEVQTVPDVPEKV